MHKDSGSNAPATPTARLRRRRGSNEVPPDVGKANESHLLVNDNDKYRSMLIRAYSSIWMIAGFVFIIYMGHLYIWAMIVIIQIFMAKELFSLLRKAHEDSHLPGFRLLNWFYVVHSYTKEEDVQISVWSICMDTHDSNCGV